MFCTRRQQIARGIRNQLRWVRAQQTADRLNANPVRYSLSHQVSGGKLVYVVTKQVMRLYSACDVIEYEDGPFYLDGRVGAGTWKDGPIVLVTEDKEEAEALACQPI